MTPPPIALRLVRDTITAEPRAAALVPAAASLLAAALLLATPAIRAPLPSLKATTHRSLSRRGIIWLGQTCNLHCEFCYFIERVHDRTHPQHPFMPLAKAQKICRTLVDVYRNMSVDIEGGEPTLYPDILELIRFCVGIGLRPTLITNALVLDNADRCRGYKDAGVGDFKISIHGLGPVHDRVVGRDGAHLRQMRALRNLQEVGIPFRFNVLLHPEAVAQLPEIARLAIATGARCVNWLGFNPHEDQQGRPQRFNLIPSFNGMRAPLTRALDLLDEAQLESNVRYVPHCMVEERHRKSIYHFQQLFYDHQEWDVASWAWTTLPPQRSAAGPTSEPIAASSLWWWLKTGTLMRGLARVPVLGRHISMKRLVNDARTRRWLYAIQRYLPRPREVKTGAAPAKLYDAVARLHAPLHCGCRQVAACSDCAARAICPGLYVDYVTRFGVEDANPIQAQMPLNDPLTYIRRQRKQVDLEDERWALPTS